MWSCRDIVVDRSCQATRERISGTVRYTADVQRPEAQAHNNRMPCTYRLRQRKCDRSAGSRLTAEGGFLDQRNGGGSGHGETIGQSAALAVGIGDSDVARA